MKKHLTFTATVLLLAVITGSHSFSQGTSFRERRITTGITEEYNSVPKLNTRIARAFLQYFDNATNLSWYEAGKNFLIKFELQGRQNRALFTPAGKLVYHVRYGTERDLPKQVRHLVKIHYYDQSITRILEIKQDGRLIWVISLEDDREYTWVRVENDELEETKRMEKQKELF